MAFCCYFDYGRDDCDYLLFRHFLHVILLQKRKDENKLIINNWKNKLLFKILIKKSN